MKTDSMKLWKVVLQGMAYNSTGIVYGESYVVATNPDEAYNKVREFLDKENLGFSHDRELKEIHLIADTYRYNDVRKLLFV